MQGLLPVPRQQTIQFLEPNSLCPAAMCSRSHIPIQNKKRQHNESFETEPYPCTSSVNQDIQGTHSHMERLSQPVSSEGDLAHTQQSITCVSPSQVGERIFQRNRIFVTGPRVPFAIQPR